MYFNKKYEYRTLHGESYYITKQDKTSKKQNKQKTKNKHSLKDFNE